MAHRLSYLSEQFPITLLSAPGGVQTQSPIAFASHQTIYTGLANMRVRLQAMFSTFAQTQPSHAETMHGALRFVGFGHLYAGERRGGRDKTVCCL
jgi:hypothetical protein